MSTDAAKVLETVEEFGLLNTLLANVATLVEVTSPRGLLAMA